MIKDKIGYYHEDYPTLDFKPVVGYEFGLSKTFPVKCITIEPLVKYGFSKHSYKKIYYNSQSINLINTSHLFEYRTLNVSVHVKEKILRGKNGLYLLFGPYLEFTSSGYAETESSFYQGINIYTRYLNNYATHFEQRKRFGASIGFSTSVKNINFRLVGQLGKTSVLIPQGFGWQSRSNCIISLLAGFDLIKHLSKYEL